eukprot:TRINITY_DN8215_c0_g1_i1.p1 TRINITY_DN8215_c0_g1~~TRINITY_DN8215_c0_g1_i1.p1  ORF type:complete len:133 (+),score=35.01 TRINITY_DN8215_c0_g1_i1:1-399(+)
MCIRASINAEYGQFVLNQSGDNNAQSNPWESEEFVALLGMVIMRSKSSQILSDLDYICFFRERWSEIWNPEHKKQISGIFYQDHKEKGGRKASKEKTGEEKWGAEGEKKSMVELFHRSIKFLLHLQQMLLEK